MIDQSAKGTGTLVKALAAASFGLGLSEVLAPGKVAAVAGVDETARSRTVIRALGARECGHGAALLASPDRLVWTLPSRRCDWKPNDRTHFGRRP